MDNYRIGNGYDVHRFSQGRPLFLGGVKIQYEFGLLGHSDADVLLHAIMDSLLGAAGLGDIGKLFPDTSSEFKDVSSLKLLSIVASRLHSKHAHVINIDATVVCEKPRILPYIEDMKRAISSALIDVPIERINIKGTTSEGLGFTGRREGVAAYAVSLIKINGSRSAE